MNCPSVGRRPPAAPGVRSDTESGAPGRRCPASGLRVMNRSFWNALCLATSTALILSACGRSNPVPARGSSAGPPAATASPITEPTPVVTQSGAEMVYLPGGTFIMGSSDGNPDEAPPHPVTVSSFLMDKFEVTQEMFAKVQLPNPSHWQDNPRNPVERVRWRDAKAYCNERSRLEGLKPCYNEKTEAWDCDEAADGYRLPTEAEWEYACRAGTTGPYDFGDAAKLRQYAWFQENSEERTHPVGQKKPNRWGLYDLYGNVCEWCEDVYSPTYYHVSPALDPLGPPSPGKDVKRVLRGGSWKATAGMARATFRQGQRTGDTDACFYTDFCGFRCVRRATAGELQALIASAR
ncbi:MAG: formylglycine-generating enzyme family protein [Verrucomicrobia bacterium]|nr:formylglycine-generating enzyme family protein [Verrucomicrobiota bacterium]